MHGSPASLPRSYANDATTSISAPQGNDGPAIERGYAFNDNRMTHQDNSCDLGPPAVRARMAIRHLNCVV